MEKPGSRPLMVFLLGLGLSVALVVGLSSSWSGAVRAYESYFSAAPNGPALPAFQGRIFLDNDPYYWITYAREMARTGSWRIRHTRIDNVPYGRPVHWSQSVAWLLVGCGKVRAWLTGEEMAAAIENGAHCVGPGILLLFVLASAFLVYKRLGAIPACLWMLGVSSSDTIFWMFHPLRPDHHGLQMAFLMGSLMCLILGGLGWCGSGPLEKAPGAWFRTLVLPERASARALFLASGILGGLGLWTGATVQLMGIGLVVVGALLLIFFMPVKVRESGEGGRYEPGLWRLWAVAGAGTSLLMYAVEYAPDFPGLRLEMLHPLHAVAWLCAGELLTRWSGRKMGLRPAAAGDDAWSAFFLAGALLLPGLLLLGPESCHSLKDASMRRLHLFIQEFHSFSKTYGPGWPAVAWKQVGILPLFILLAPWLAAPQRTRLYEWAALWMSFALTFVYLVLGYQQVRWVSFLCMMATWLMVLVLVILRRNDAEQKTGWRTGVLAALVVAQAVFVAGRQMVELRNIREGRSLVNELVKPLLQRSMIQRLAAMNTDGRMRVLCEPDLAGPLYYFGGISSVVSFYWENMDGLKSAVDFLADDGQENAARVARERGLTHVLLPHSAEMAHIFFMIQEGYFDEQGAKDSLAGRLVADRKRLPPWIQRDEKGMAATRSEYRFKNVPLSTTMDIFVIDPDQL